MDNNAWWYVNSHWVHPADATISINDMAVLRGYCVFESLRTYHRLPFHLDEHLARLYRSAALIELEVSYTRDFIAGVVHAAIEKNSYIHASIRILVTGGESEDGITPSRQATLAVLVTPLAERDMQRFARGIKLITTTLQRFLPEAKTSNYTTAVRALKEAAHQQASDALFVNEHGHVLECTRSNFFIFQGDTLVTPRTSVLLGVTRNAVLSLASTHFSIEERPILFEELPQVAEAFITSSSSEITPVIQINDWQIGTGQPGPRTAALEHHFISMIEQGEFC